MQKWVELRKLISPNWRSLLPGQFIRNCQIDLVCLFCAVGNRVANCTNVALYHPFVKSHRVGQSEESNMFTSLLDPRLIIVHPSHPRTDQHTAMLYFSLGKAPQKFRLFLGQSLRLMTPPSHPIHLGLFMTQNFFSVNILYLGLQPPIEMFQNDAFTFTP